MLLSSNDMCEHQGSASSVEYTMEGLNLASSKLGAKICCSVPSRDAHPPSNLLEGKSWMADGFIRPPVWIVVHLPCPVALRKLSWTSSLGEHTSLLHKVFASSFSLPCSPECPKASKDPNKRLADWHRVGISTARDGSVKFANRRLVKNAPTETWEKLHCSEDRFLLERVTSLKLEICSTSAASVPCMSNLIIEASPAQGKGNQKLAEQLVLRSRGQRGVAGTSAPVFSFFGGEEEKEEPEIHIIEDKPKIHITEKPTALPTAQLIDCDPPQDFLDSITEEVMEMPMTLPSGHTVDRSTLDKCTDHFASWGGPPRDPYTGKLFCKGSEPVFNPGLKSRIDRWRAGFGGGGKSGGGGRTLGNAQQISKFLEAKSVKRKLMDDVAAHTPSKVIIIDD